MADPAELALIVGAFLVAGIVKGIVGLGMPIVVVASLSPFLGLAQTIPLLIVPGFVTNLRQGFRGGRLRPILARQRWVLMLTVAGIWIGTGVLASVNTQFLSVLLGLLLMLYAVYALLLPPLPPPGPVEPVLAPTVGITAGLMCGMVGIWAVPGVIYYAILRLQRDELVQTLGITFIILSLALGLSLAHRGLLPADQLLLSVVALPAAIGGMLVGERLRSRLPERRFRHFFLVALLVMGLNIALTA